MRSCLAVAIAAGAILVAVAPAATAQNVRISAGASTTDAFFGNAIGVDFRGETFVAAWGDNSAELGGNPDRPALDVAFAALGAANVNVTTRPRSQSGVSLAVDPTDPNRVVLAALGGDSSPMPGVIRAFSRDGGATWNAVSGLPGNLGAFAPAVAFDAFGNCFLALVHDLDFGNPRVELYVSTDGGATFAPVALPPRTAIETNISVAAGFGSVWIALQSYDGNVRIKTFSAPVSETGAVGPFTEQTLLGSLDGVAPDVALRPGGAAVVAYGHGQFTTTPTVSVQVDADGLGDAGFGPRIPVANVPGYPNLPQAEVAVDRTSGRVYFVYSDRQEGAGPEEVRLNFSDDLVDWSPAVTISDAVRANERNFPNVAVSAGGSVGVAWYDLRSGAPELFGDVRASVERPPNPRAPLNLSATGVSRSQIDLAWTDTSDNETAFQVQRSTGNPFEAPPIVAVLPANTTSWSDTGLPEDTGFGYRVRAVNAAGPSLWSNFASAITLATPPAAPTELTATAITFQRIDLAWQPSANADSYEVQQSTDGVAFTTIGHPTVTAIMIFGLQSSTTYFFRVRAVNSGGPSPWSDVASATTLAEDQPPAPTELSAFALSKSRIRLSWLDNSVNETRFVIERSSGGAFERAGTASENAQLFTDSGLRSGTTYSYRVRACNGDLCSPSSNVATATTPRR